MTPVTASAIPAAATEDAGARLWKWALSGLAVAGVGAAIVIATRGPAGTSTPPPLPAPAVVSPAEVASTDAAVTASAGSDAGVAATNDPTPPRPDPIVEQPKDPPTPRKKGSSRPRGGDKPPADAGVAPKPREPATPRPPDDPESLVNPFPGRTR
jgi:hypothetical protein